MSSDPFSWSAREIREAILEAETLLRPGLAGDTAEILCTGRDVLEAQVTSRLLRIEMVHAEEVRVSPSAGTPFNPPPKLGTLLRLAKLELASMQRER